MEIKEISDVNKILTETSNIDDSIKKADKKEIYMDDTIKNDVQEIIAKSRELKERYKNYNIDELRIATNYNF